MISIESYIIKNKRSVVADINNIDKDLFGNVVDYKSLNTGDLDYDYLEGAIVLNYNGQQYLDFENWDLIEQLWSYFIIAIENLKQEERVSFQFPDSPFLIKIEKKNNSRLIVLFDKKRMDISSFEFISTMLNAAALFYQNLKHLFIAYEWDIEEQIEIIQKVKSIWSVK